MATVKKLWWRLGGFISHWLEGKEVSGIIINYKLSIHIYIYIYIY